MSVEQIFLNEVSIENIVLFSPFQPKGFVPDNCKLFQGQSVLVIVIISAQNLF